MRTGIVGTATVRTDDTGTGTVRTGAALLALAVALGAFGTHALEPGLAPERLETFETAVRYQLVHGLGLLLLGLLGRRARLAGRLLLAGTVIFCGSLYLLVLTDTTWLGAVAPIGGGLLILGWLWLALRLQAA